MKPFKNLEEQIEILKDRNLFIEDEQAARNYLLRNNYYNVINMYSRFFQDSTNSYIEGSTFEEIKAIHILDTEIKTLLLKALIKIEFNIKSIISYRFAEAYHKNGNPYSYLDRNNYSKDNPLSISTTLGKISRTISQTINEKNINTSFKHHRDKYKDVPVWVVINELTFGVIPHLYQYFDKKIQNKISKDVSDIFHTHNQNDIFIDAKQLTIMLFNFNSLRNCVAHNNKLFEFNSRNTIKYIEELHKPLNISSAESKQSVYHLFVYMKLFLTYDEYSIIHNSILKRIKNTSNKISSIDINEVLIKYGFPIDWKNSEKMKQKNNPAH